MDKHRHKIEFIISFVYYCIIFTLFLLGVKYLLSPLLPFIAAFIIVTASRKIITHIAKGPISQKGASIIFTLLVIIIISLAIFGITYSIFTEVSALSQTLSEKEFKTFSQNAGDFLQNLPSRISWFPFIDSISNYLQKSIIKFDETLLDIAKDYMPRVLSAAMKFLSFFPAAVIFLTLMFIAMFYIGCDYDTICSFLTHQLPKGFSEQFYEAKDTFFLTAKELFKAYFVLTVITFLQLLTGFLIMRIDYAVILALVICIVDLIPILGTGTVLIPWSIISIFTGDYPNATGLIILYILIALFRRIAEPKIVGANIGLSPLLSLISMYVGLKIAGFAGIIIFPLITITAISLNEKGLIKLYRNMPENSEKKIQKTKRKFLDFKKHDNSQ